MLNKILHYGKLASASVVIVASAYAIGTFQPNQYTVDKVTEQTREEHSNWAMKLGLHEPTMNYETNEEFLSELEKCVDFLNFTTPPSQRVAVDMLVGQAVLESAWGQSRFAHEANNLFGIRTFGKDVPHVLPLGVKKWPGWGVRKFETKCASVKEYMRLLNEHSAYQKYRDMRDDMLKNGEELDGTKLIGTINEFSTTVDYDKRVLRIMKKVEEVKNGVKEEDGFEIEIKEKPMLMPEPKPDKLGS